MTMTASMRLYCTYFQNACILLVNQRDRKYIIFTVCPVPTVQAFRTCCGGKEGNEYTDPPRKKTSPSSERKE